MYDAAERYIQDRYTPYYKEVLRFFQIPLTPGEFLDRWITIKCDKSFTWFKEKLANTSLEMILIPKQDANLEDFLLSKHQITQAIWQDVMGTSPSYFKGGSLPVEDISWIAAVEFCQKLSTLTNKQYRLPTQSEWEYACKIGGVSDETTQLENVAWYCKNASGTTHSVGQREPSTFGLCDLLGNVFEMCSDNITMDNLNIEEGEIEQPDRVARGGAWDQDEDSCKISYRRFIRKNVGYKNVGFRVAISRASLSSEHTSASHKCDCCCQY